ncbi:TetR/AcrR family transcriptional regulator [Mucilaginibacter sp.]|uniref:TetR/AcrR family transcriptional regulator n=1 Tax=Mucilaginibacter sp. TaxID=1882438 RepID=UPI002634BB5E|nr:TetR/AcrR family transcriptional regulator [Mucilaginibacter sp.]MDB4920208.1 TetR family transcriptional regulator [Mucilaginibacter sp.]
MKEEITKVALERFMQYDIRSMTIKKLVEPLGISTKTVYKYFKSKEELLEECLRLMYRQFSDDLELLLKSNENPAVTLLTLFRSSLAKDFGINHGFFYDLNHYYPELQNVALAREQNNFAKKILPIVENGVVEGYFKNDTNPAIALTGIGVLYASITRSGSYDQFGVSANVLFKNLVEVYIRGMCTEKGIKEIEINPQHNK